MNGPSKVSENKDDRRKGHVYFADDEDLRKHTQWRHHLSSAPGGAIVASFALAIEFCAYVISWKFSCSWGLRPINALVLALLTHNFPCLSFLETIYRLHRLSFQVLLSSA